MRRWFALVVAVAVGCAAPPRTAPSPSPPRTVTPAPPAAATTVPDPIHQYAPPAASFLEWADLPGCSRERAAAVKTRLDRVEAALRPAPGDEPHALEAILVDLDDAWSSPCLAHVARFFARPAVATTEELYELWFRGLRGVRAMIGGLYVRNGKRFFFAPPTTASPLDDEARRALAPLSCSAKESRCGNVGTFVERSFDAGEERLRLWHEEHGWDLCKDLGDSTARSSFTPSRKYARSYRAPSRRSRRCGSPGATRAARSHLSGRSPRRGSASRS